MSLFDRWKVLGAVSITVLGACATAASILEMSGGGGVETLTIGAGGNDVGIPCIESSAIDVLSSRPVDVIFVIDDSGSMSDELSSISKNINEHFADVMADAGLDYRVIMVVMHGGHINWGQVCIEAPLSTIPKGGCSTVESEPPGNNPGKFYHYSYDVQSNDSPCVILDTLTATNDRPDTFGLAPKGWITWLRKSAFKVFIEVTDDMPNCVWYADPVNQKGKKVFNDFYSNVGGQIMATEWDKILTKIAPEQFGTPEKRNYTFFSVVGMLEKPEATDDDTGFVIDPNGTPDEEFSPAEGIVMDTCSTAVASGTGYQHLSKMTGGLRFPVCQAEKFDVVFEKIAGSIDSITSTQCVIEIPQSGAEGIVNIDTVTIEVEGNDGSIVTLKKVSSFSDCTSGSDEFFVDPTGSVASLCPDTCKAVKPLAKEVRLSAACIPEVK